MEHTQTRRLISAQEKTKTCAAALGAEPWRGALRVDAAIDAIVVVFGARDPTIVHTERERLYVGRRVGDERAQRQAVGARLRTFESRGEDRVGAYGERRAVRREEFVRHIRLPRIGPRATDLLRQHRTNGGLRVGRHGKRWPLL